MLSEHQPWNSENRELEIGQISKIKLFSNTVDDCLQRQIAEHHCSKQSLNQKACPVNAGHCMAFKHCKLLLRSTQNHARNSFQAFVCCHLKMLCCSIWIWADSLFQKSHQIISAVFARDSIWNILFCSYVIFLLKSSQLCHWFCSQNLWLSPGKTFRSNCQMTCRCKNVDSNLNSAAWAMGCGCSRILLLVQFRQGVPQICHLWVSEGEEWMLPVPPSFPKYCWLSQRSHPTALLSTKLGYNVLQDNLGKFQVILKTLTDLISQILA